MAAEFPPPGFLQWGRSGVDPYEEHVGPFYQNPDQQTMTMLVTPRMCNALGILHGGALMSFCDAALYVIAREHTYETTGRVPCGQDDLKSCSWFHKLYLVGGVDSAQDA